MNWQRISRAGKPDVRGVLDERRLVVHVPLSAPPPAAWRNYFLDTYQEVRRRHDGEWPLPELREQEVVIFPLDSELESWIKALDERIEKANDHFEKNVLPRDRQREAVQEEQRRRQEKRLEDARRVADQLEPDPPPQDEGA